jgi:hypothetical protein
MAYAKLVNAGYGKTLTWIRTAKDNRISKARRESWSGIPSWRFDFHLQNRRDHSWIGVRRNIDLPEILEWAYRDDLRHLEAYRARYYSNLRVKYGRGELQYKFTVRGLTIYNGAVDLSLDQWSIETTLRDLSFLRRIAVRRGITL